MSSTGDSFGSALGDRPGWGDVRRVAWKAVRICIVLLVGIAALTSLERSYEEKFYGQTGDGEWIWLDRNPLAGNPVAFFAARNFTLTKVKKGVKVRIAADPSYELWLNGTEVGRRRANDGVTLDEYDVTALVKPGLNRIVVGLRSANGIGGLLVGIDFGPTLQNEIVSDRSWDLYDAWSPRLLDFGGADIPAERPALLGRPPSGRWNFLESDVREIVAERESTVSSRQRFDASAEIPEVRVVSGVAVLSARSATVTVFDFGPIHDGRAEVARHGSGTEVVSVRYLAELGSLAGPAAPDELVIAKGERWARDLTRHDFRYLVVYEANAEANVLVPAEIRR